MNIELDQRRLRQAVEGLADRLTGSWLVLGGAAVALWLEPRRVTEDIDIVSIGGGAGDRLALMEAADQLGLPIEAVNSAADFFVHRIRGWEREIEVLHVGARATIYRPNATLLVLLKVGRLSERDLLDCRVAVEHCARERLPLDAPRVLAALDALPPVDDGETTERRRELRVLLAASR
jgi:hypothetical protein